MATSSTLASRCCRNQSPAPRNDSTAVRQDGRGGAGDGADGLDLAPVSAVKSIASLTVYLASGWSLRDPVGSGRHRRPDPADLSYWCAIGPDRGTSFLSVVEPSYRVWVL